MSKFFNKKNKYSKLRKEKDKGTNMKGFYLKQKIVFQL